VAKRERAGKERWAVWVCPDHGVARAVSAVGPALCRHKRFDPPEQFCNRRLRKVVVAEVEVPDWVEYEPCWICGVEAGAPCRVIRSGFKDERVEPHFYRALHKEEG
jgi:hypothetical protein